MVPPYICTGKLAAWSVVGENAVRRKYILHSGGLLRPLVLWPSAEDKAVPRGKQSYRFAK